MCALNNCYDDFNKFLEQLRRLAEEHILEDLIERTAEEVYHRFFSQSTPQTRTDADVRPLDRVEDYDLPKEEDVDDTWLHYTDQVGVALIASTGVIRANSRGIVYVTKEWYSATEAFYALFAGDPDYINKGDYVVQFVVNQGVRFWNIDDRIPEATQPNEWIHYGSLSLGVEIKYFSYIGPNPFN
jgi:hypothetical protein